MDWNIISQMIGSVGFPILACVVMFQYMQKEAENHKKEIDSLKESLNNNTLALTRLYERLGKEDE